VEDGVTDLGAMVGHAAVLTVERGPLARKVHGVVRAAEHTGTLRSRRHARVQVVPTLWLLSQRRDCRIFQDLNAIDIVSEVLRDAGLYQASGELDLSSLSPSNYAVREYTTQYNESDLDFVMRLLEDEGITFFFAARAAGERLVLVDDAPADAFPEPVPVVGGLPLRVMGEGGATHDAETVREFGFGFTLQPTSVALRDWDFTRPFHTSDPSPARESALTRAVPSPMSERQVYSYPARAVLHSYDPGALFYRGDDLARRATVRWTELTAQAQRCTGRGVVTGLVPGRRMSLSDEDGGDLGAYTVTAVEHTGRVEEGSFDAHPPSDLDRYSNRFEGVLVPTVFRPPRVTPRPTMSGPQTAVVLPRVGSTEEVDVDPYGRVLVRFHWERPDQRVSSQRSKNSSCRVRVSQPWAGSGWGVIFHPRVGMEVVVQFLDGDPDRPLVTGCVYNLHNQPPPPGEVVQRRTRSTIRTNSSPGSRGYNELAFEDLADREEIFVHAQKDFNELVEHDHTTRVRRDQSVTVTRNQSHTIEANQSETVGGNQSHTVHHNRTSTVGGNESHQVIGLYRLTVSGVIPPPPPPAPGSPPPPPPPPPPPSGALHITGDYSIESTTKITLKVGSSTVTLTPDGVQINGGGGAGAWYTTEAESHSHDGSKLKLDAKAVLRSKDASQVILDGNARVHANAGGDLNLTADANLHAPGGVHLHNDGGAVIDLVGPLVKLNMGGPYVGPPTTGLGADVDLMAGMSPALAQRIRDLQAQGWTIRYSRPGDPPGTFCDRTTNSIVIDPNANATTAQRVQSLAHEAGHAGYTPGAYVPPSGLTRQEYIDRNAANNLADEGEATLFNAQARREIMNNGGPDIGIAGAQSQQYANTYDQYAAGNLTRDQARTQIGQTFANGETPSTAPNMNYGQYYGQPYGTFWDQQYPGQAPGWRAP
jgi:type VI secretion system secreted protein VgrG